MISAVTASSGHALGCCYFLGGSAGRIEAAWMMATEATYEQRCGNVRLGGFLFCRGLRAAPRFGHLDLAGVAKR
jgi:hypothetical protein